MVVVEREPITSETAIVAYTNNRQTDIRDDIGKHKVATIIFQ